MKLFIPGPTQVAPEILAEMSRPAIGHRTEECARLWKECRDGLRQLMATEGEILMITGPASAMMEAAIRNTVADRSLHLVCGAFSKRWFDIALSCGKDAVALELPLGQGFRGEEVREALQSGVDAGRPFEAVTLVHNETSTGVTSPLEEIGAVVAKFPNTLLLVDTVSSMAGMPVMVDAWGVDVCLFGIQKAMALPAGLAIASVSTAALERAETVPHRGWFLDFIKLRDRNRREQSPTTPSTAHLYALAAQLCRIFEEGLETRWERHAAMARQTREWAAGHGWTPFPEEGFLSDTVSCLARGEGPDFVPALDTLKEQGILVSNGYGELKGKTFRIGHMGEHTSADLDDLFERFDAALGAEVGEA